MLKYLYTAVILLFLSPWASAQELSGTWAGELRQDGKPAVFHYEITIRQEGSGISGLATSRDAKGGTAKFEIAGMWDGSDLVLQEIAQLEPPNARWCLKHIRLQPAKTTGPPVFEGTWEAQDCDPGTLRLQKLQGTGEEKKASPSSADGQPALPGKWTGHLSQSDRDYGFYFEMKFEPDGSGSSYIVSDGEGGNALLRLRWTFDKAAGRLDFEETGIIEESVPDWRWCIKSGSLHFKKEENRLSLTGSWKGFIEGYTTESGPCAPGNLYVERPVFKKEDMTQPAAGQPANLPAKPLGVLDYENKMGREVEVGRVLEVRNKTIRIRVWDGGTVDGDVCTLFLNGQLILKKYRVSRRKHAIVVKLEKSVNYLVLHADDLGSITPNTVAVSVDDGVREQIVLVSSNLKTSGAIMIRQFTVGE